MMEKENMSDNNEKELELINLDRIVDERLRNPKPPWKHARRLEKEKAAEFITVEDIYTRINKIENLRNRVLCIILYLCAARCEEVVRYTPIKYGKKRVRLVNKGKTKNKDYVDYSKKKFFPTKRSLSKNDISIMEEDGRKIMLFKLRNLKTKQRNKMTKLIPVPLDNQNNKNFIKPIVQYLSLLSEEEELFPFTLRRAEQITNEIGFNTHFFRKLRLTHLVKYHNFSDQKLVFFSGWSDSRPARNYIKIGWKDLVSSM